jgi:hypothetical protein
VAGVVAEVDVVLVGVVVVVVVVVVVGVVVVGAVWVVLVLEDVVVVVCTAALQLVVASAPTVETPWSRFLRRVELTVLGRLATTVLRFWVAFETVRQSPDCSAEEMVVSSLLMVLA